LYNFAFACCALLTSTPAFAQTSPAPTASPKPTPSPLSYSGYYRGYYFTRQNTSGYPQTFKMINQATFNQTIDLHVGYQFENTPVTIGATYLYANPLNGCQSPTSHLSLPCGKHTFTAHAPAPTNPDDTLPGFELSTLYEAYVQYKDPAVYLKLGDEVVTTPWANPSDSRLKPVAFQGGDFSYKIDPRWTIEGMYMDRFESRASSNFDNSTLLTSHPADAPGAASNIFTPGGRPITTAGFAYGRLGYADAQLSANVHYYGFLNIANALWFDGKFTSSQMLKPYVVWQIGTESNAGSAVIGKISSQVYGIQGGFMPFRNVDLNVSYDYIPEKSDTMTLPKGVTCSSSKHSISVSPGVTFPYFLPTSGTPNCFPNANGTARIYYGGWASPYTDSYATDPLFTTSVSQGLIDRRSSGSAFKVGGTFTMDNKRIRVIVSRAWYLYGNGIAGIANTQETNIDGTYFFNPVRSGPYKGFSLRHRYAERTQAYTQFYGGLPLFKYNRTQLEYAF